MYENITKYLEVFGEDGASVSPEQVAAFADAFTQSGLMDPNGMETMGARGWATRTALREAAPTMTAQEACACISAFVLQESFIPGVLADQIAQGILPLILKRLKELDA